MFWPKRGRQHESERTGRASSLSGKRRTRVVVFIPHHVCGGGRVDGWMRGGGVVAINDSLISRLCGARRSVDNKLVFIGKQAPERAQQFRWTSIWVLLMSKEVCGSLRH